jgi:hypothetical protein
MSVMLSAWAGATTPKRTPQNTKATATNFPMLFMNLLPLNPWRQSNPLSANLLCTIQSKRFSKAESHCLLGVTWVSGVIPRVN